MTDILREPGQKTDPRPLDQPIPGVAVPAADSARTDAAPSPRNTVDPVRLGAALSLRDAVDPVAMDVVLPADEIARHFAEHFAGIPATPLTRDEPAVTYQVPGSAMPVLLGAYGAERRVRDWLPGLPDRTDRAAAHRLAAAAIAPVTVADPVCAQVVSMPGDLTALPALTATPRDAGPYLTTGIVMAGDVAMSVHRMLVLDATRLAIWMVPGRALRRLHESTGRLAVSVNIGAPPAAMVASALGTAFLPAGVDKLSMAGALAGAPARIATGVSQAVPVLADSEIVIEGYLDDTVADETLDGPPGVSLPEFLGYDGEARTGLPVITVTAVTTRRDPLFHAVIGPGREQSVILGLAGAVSVALSDTGPHGHLLHDLHFSAAGGGMLLLVAAVRKTSADDDGALADLAERILRQHFFVKLVVFTDPDVDIRAPEDVLWAMTTRTNLGTDTGTISGFGPLPVDPSHSATWREGRSDRSFVDATTPFSLRHNVFRSFGGQP
ncbi:UbiD family decarboxylase, blr3531 type [Alloactinosynnema sp. L-07]|uniref:UbiD family decarboxylase n=1 Tax=Alloactinosynnema sp. L-07 TaxID=1653480 RepID=UPI00065F0042|nr:UbiD family decarboxylase [Alloactinosynnema sp. L-07]CRK58159.1 UbiD family decarboxylase, blr3531 type [Alloactinosynnema sp. L-07]